MASVTSGRGASASDVEYIFADVEGRAIFSSFLQTTLPVKVG